MKVLSTSALATVALLLPVLPGCGYMDGFQTASTSFMHSEKDGGDAGGEGDGSSRNEETKRKGGGDDGGGGSSLTYKAGAHRFYDAKNDRNWSFECSNDGLIETKYLEGTVWKSAGKTRYPCDSFSVSYKYFDASIGGRVVVLARVGKDILG